MSIPALSFDLVHPAHAAKQVAAPTHTQSEADDRKIDKSSKDFEALLLNSWFQKAYESFGSLPGSDDPDELGAGSDQFQGIAMQGLATAIVNAGGIGIAKMMADHLRKSTHSSGSIPDPTRSIPALPADIPPDTIETVGPDGR